MNNNLNLEKITAYMVVASIDDRSSGITGYYSNYTAAAINTSGVGWYGSNGEVQEHTVYTDGDKIYEVKCLGQFSDTSEKEKNEMLERIKNKLTPDEWEFYKQQSNEQPK